MDIQTNNTIEFEWDEEKWYDFHKRDTEEYSISAEEIEFTFETELQSEIDEHIDEDMIDAEEIIDELEDDVYSETDEVKFLEQETLMYGME